MCVYMHIYLAQTYTATTTTKMVTAARTIATAMTKRIHVDSVLGTVGTGIMASIVTAFMEKEGTQHSYRHYI